MIKICAKCGSEFETKGNGKWCEDCKPNVRAKDIIESIEEVKEEIVTPKLIGMVETKQKNKADELWSAIRLLHNQKQNITTLLTETEDKMKKCETELSDNQHKMFLLNMTEEDLLGLAKEQREILSKRSGYKNLLTIYKLMERLEFNPEATQHINYGKTYRLKTEVGQFSYGDVMEGFLNAQAELEHSEHVKEEEKAKEVECMKELKDYVETLHETPITGKMITTIAFAKGSLKDLQCKVGQLEAKARAFRIDLGRSTITYYN